MESFYISNLHSIFYNLCMHFVLKLCDIHRIIICFVLCTRCWRSELVLEVKTSKNLSEKQLKIPLTHLIKPHSLATKVAWIWFLTTLEKRTTCSNYFKNLKEPMISKKELILKKVVLWPVIWFFSIFWEHLYIQTRSLIFWELAWYPGGLLYVPVLGGYYKFQQTNPPTTTRDIREVLRVDNHDSQTIKYPVLSLWLFKKPYSDM